MEALINAHVLVVGVGGVGGTAVELLARAGVGTFTLVDADCVEESNLNRQAVASRSTLGQRKVDAMESLVKEINPEVYVHKVPCFVTPENVNTLFIASSLQEGSLPPFSFVVDAIDTLAPKCALIVEALKHGIPLISSMGAGAKLDPTRVAIVPISKTHSCGLAKAVRQRLRFLGCKASFPAVFSSELAIEGAVFPVSDGGAKKSIVGTVSYMPQLFGLYIASFVIRSLTGHL